MVRRTVVCALAASLLLPAGAAARGPSVQASGLVAPGPHLFGDRVRLALELLVDTKRTDPDKVKVNTSFDPFQRVGGVRREREREGDYVRLTFGYTVECLFPGCLPELGKAEKRIDFPQAVVRYRMRNGGRQGLAVTWPTFRMVSRFVPPTEKLDASEIRARLQFQNDPIVRLFATLKPPPPTYHLSPIVLAALLLAAALAALACAGLVTRPLIAEALARRARGDEDRTTALERALERVDRAARRNAGAPEHREALARLARELRSTGRRDLVAPARRLAWSEAAPSADESTALTHRVRESLGGAA
jgi:hypothetical protein